MRQKYASLLENSTFTPVTNANGVKPIGCGWVYKTKRVLRYLKAAANIKLAFPNTTSTEESSSRIHRFRLRQRQGRSEVTMWLYLQGVRSSDLMAPTSKD